MREWVKFWRASFDLQLITSVFAMLVAWLFTWTPLVMKGLMTFDHEAEKFFMCDNHDTVIGLMTCMLPMLLFAAFAGLASRTTIVSLRWIKFQILKRSLRRLDERLYGSGSPYRIPPIEQGQARHQLADEQESDQVLYAEMQQELQKIQRCNEI